MTGSTMAEQLLETRPVKRPVPGLGHGPQAAVAGVVAARAGQPGHHSDHEAHRHDGHIGGPDLGLEVTHEKGQVD